MGYGEEASEPLSKQDVSKLVVEDLKGLPDEWLDELLTAVRLGDTEAMLSLTETLDAEHAETKTKLDHCIREFQLEYLIKTLTEKCEPKEKTDYYMT